MGRAAQVRSRSEQITMDIAAVRRPDNNVAMYMLRIDSCVRHTLRGGDVFFCTIHAGQRYLCVQAQSGFLLQSEAGLLIDRLVPARPRMQAKPAGAPVRV